MEILFLLLVLWILLTIGAFMIHWIVGCIWIVIWCIILLIKD